MNNIAYNQVSHTYSSVSAVVGVGLLAFISRASSELPVEAKRSFSNYTPYQKKINSPTFDNYRNLFTGEYNSHVDYRFEQAIASFYSRLLESQESLGDEFAEVLYKNLWDLYEN